MTKKIVTMSVHGDREDCIEKAEEIGLGDWAAKMFWWSIEEFGVELEVDMETGSTKLLKIAGKEVK